MATTIMESLRDFFNLCPALAGGYINVDYLPESTSKSGAQYSINSMPGEEVVKQFLDGSAECQYPFIISSVNSYTGDALLHLDNSGLYEAITSWIRQQQRKRALPALPPGMTSRRVEVQSTAYLMTASGHTGKYQMQCRLVYYRKGER